MNELKKNIIRTPIVGNAIVFGFRVKTAFGYFREPLANLFKWLFKSRETTNFTYELEKYNKRYLAALISDVTGTSIDVVLGYFREIEGDQVLRKHVVDLTAQSKWSFLADEEARFGRRIGWYAFARILKPRVVVETGVDKGLGACVLTAALKRNQEEGFEGRYYGTDLNPKAGYLLSGEYSDFGSVLYGDSIESLKEIGGSIDLFVNDSDHSPNYETEEYMTIKDKLAEGAIVLGDNAHCSGSLFEFSMEVNRSFVFFQEKPLDHWHPGSGIGISFKRGYDY